MDVHVPLAITVSLRLKGVSVVTAQEDGAEQLDDSLLLDRATQLGCILVTQDKDLLSEARQRQSTGGEFCGLVFAPQLRTTIGQTLNAPSEKNGWI
jgi:predicted nuclease of predicted toxin-antitoxin system